MVNDSYEDAYDFIIEAMKLVKKSVDEAFEKKKKLWFWQFSKAIELSSELSFLYGKHQGLYELANRLLEKRESLLNAKEKKWTTPQQ